MYAEPEWGSEASLVETVCHLAQQWEMKMERKTGAKSVESWRKMVAKEFRYIKSKMESSSAPQTGVMRDVQRNRTVHFFIKRTSFSIEENNHNYKVLLWSVLGAD